MNVRKNVDYSDMFATLDSLMAAHLPQMHLYAEIGRLVSTRPEKGAAVAAAEYLCDAYPNASGFSPRNLRRMRDFYRTYENTPETLAQAMTIGWTQNVVILEAALTLQERAWYIRATGRFGWSKLELQRKVIANAHMDSSIDFSDAACYTEENSAAAEPQKTWQEENTLADKIKIRGARVHNLKNIDVDVPLGGIVGIAGVSGSGKSSLALGVLYAEGSRRYLESLSTYTRRRMTQAAKAQVDEVLYVPAALALRQRPGVPGIRSTFGTGTELLGSLRLMYSRLSSHRCPKGHYVPPTLAVAAGQELVCPVCGTRFYAPSAEELAFNSQGACRTCDGTGTVRTVDLDTLVPDDSLTIDEGAVRPWQTLMWSLMKDIAREMGIRTDVPFRELTDQEKELVFHGPTVKRHILYQNPTSGVAAEMDFTYFNAVYTVENALSKVKDEKGMKRVEKFLKQETCLDCHCSRLSEAARGPKLQGIPLDEACRMTLSELTDWVAAVLDSLPEGMQPMTHSICEPFRMTAKRLMDLGLGYLTLDRASSTLSTGERQRMQLAREVHNRTTGVLYVLDEPTIGLHPLERMLLCVFQTLIDSGATVIMIEHDLDIIHSADYIIDMGPSGGEARGRIVATGTLGSVHISASTIRAK